MALFLGAAPASAHCPLCTAATIAGLETARYYGVDDSIVGIWIGAFVISTALWFDAMLKKRKHSIQLQSEVLSVSALVLTVVPFYFAGLLSNPVKILGIDRLLFGMLAGSIITYGGTGLSIRIKNARGKVLFPYQTIILIVALLAAASAVFWYLIRNTGVFG